MEHIKKYAPLIRNLSISLFLVVVAAGGGRAGRAPAAWWGHAAVNLTS